MKSEIFDNIEVRDSPKAIEISCELVQFTDKALLINDGEKDVWIPKSQISDYVTKKDDNGCLVPISIFIPEWLAKDKGLI